jgi:phage gp46-like protein
MSDILLIQTENDGDVIYGDGDLKTEKGLQTAAYLSLFGGNRDDAGFSDKTKMYWANYQESDVDYQYRSETQALLSDNTLTTALLLRLEDAVLRDLNWLINNKYAATITVEASIPAIDRLKLDIKIDNILLQFVEDIN